MDAIQDRLPPHSIASEQAVLGCVLLAPNECMSICVEMITSEEFFYDMRHQSIYAVLLEMFSSFQTIEPLLVCEHLKSRNQLETLGGFSYIAGLPDCTPAASSIGHYIEILKEKFILRSLIRVGTLIVRNGFDSESAAVALAESESEMVKVGKSVQTGGEDKDIKALVHTVLGEMSEACDNQGRPRGLAVGFADLDSLTSGFRPGQMIVIAARPSCGKTSLAMNMAEDVAVNQKIPTGVISMEMTSEDLIFRMVCTRARVNSKHARDGALAERDFPKLTMASNAIATAPLYICEKGGMTIGQLAGRVRRMFSSHKIKFLIIDYIQLMQGSPKVNRNEQLTSISNGIKALAKELGIPIVVLSQLNREITKENRSPRISDLRECGAIEQDADIIILLDPKIPDDKKGKNIDDDRPRKIPDIQDVVALIPKNRNGPVQSINLTFFRTFTRFESASKVADVNYDV